MLGLQSMGRIRISNEERRNFLITNSNSLHWLQAQQKMSQLRNSSYLCSHTNANWMGVLLTHRWRNQFFKTMHYYRTMKHTYGIKFMPIKLYTHQLCITKMWLSFMNVVKSYSRWKIAKVFLTPSTCLTCTRCHGHCNTYNSHDFV